MAQQDDAIRLVRLEEQLAALQRRFEDRITTDAEALLEAREKLDAHLETLNNATERAEAVAKTVVSRDKYDSDQKRIITQMAFMSGAAGAIAYFLSLFFHK
jgi:DNA repair exonuclease SbcCD ATPase subunit